MMTSTLINIKEILPGYFKLILPNSLKSFIDGLFSKTLHRNSWASDEPDIGEKSYVNNEFEWIGNMLSNNIDYN